VLTKNNTKTAFFTFSNIKTRQEAKVIRADDGHIDPDLAKRGM
jgi:hypothetical protein